MKGSGLFIRYMADPILDNGYSWNCWSRLLDQTVGAGSAAATGAPAAKGKA